MPFISLYTILVENLRALLNTLQYYYSLILIISLSIFWKYIYLATHISKLLFLHFSYTISYTLTTPLHITRHNSSKLHSYTLSLSISRRYVHLIAPISKYLNTSLYSSLTKSFLLESNLYNFSNYNFSNSYNLIFLLSLTTLFIILPYIIHTTSHKTSISFTISTLLKRYQTLILKAHLMEGISF